MSSKVQHSCLLLSIFSLVAWSAMLLIYPWVSPVNLFNPKGSTLTCKTNTPAYFHRAVVIKKKRFCSIDTRWQSRRRASYSGQGDCRHRMHLPEPCQRSGKKQSSAVLTKRWKGPGNPYWRRRISTVELLVLTSSDKLFLMLKLWHSLILLLYEKKLECWFCM